MNTLKRKLPYTENINEKYELLNMVVAPSRHVFDEDFYVLFMCILLCFKCVLGSA